VVEPTGQDVCSVAEADTSVGVVWLYGHLSVGMDVGVVAAELAEYGHFPGDLVGTSEDLSTVFFLGGSVQDLSIDIPPMKAR
jgi:hypothetical protein